MIKSKHQWEQEFKSMSMSERIHTRSRHILKYGFPILTHEVLEKLISTLKGQKVVEVGCGNAFLSACLRDKGVDITPIDTFESKYNFMGNFVSFQGHKHMAVKNADATKLHFSKYDAVIMSWPDYNVDFAERIAKRMKQGQLLVYQGEGKYGCTGNNGFHDYLESNFEELDVDFWDDHVRFDGIHDQWRVYLKQST